MDVIGVIKEHPLAIGGAAVFIVLLIALRSGSSNNGSTVSNTIGASLQSQQLANQANTAISQINSQRDIAIGAQSTSAYTAALNANAADSIARTNFAANALSSIVSANTTANAIDSETMLKTILGGLQHQDNNQLFANNLQTQLAQINTGANIAALKINSDLSAITQNIQERKYETDNATYRLTTNSQTAENLARINGANSLNVAQTNTSAARTASTAAAVGSVVNTLNNSGILSSLFGGGSGTASAGSGFLNTDYSFI